MSLAQNDLKQQYTRDIATFRYFMFLQCLSEESFAQNCLKDQAKF